MLKCDLVLFSRHSATTSWFLRQAGLSLASSTPQELYAKLKQQGFDLITLTDYNTIDGCLELAQNNADVFLSETVTTFFPEDKHPLDLLVWNITEAQHREIQSLKSNLFELADYLKKHHLTHGVRTSSQLLTPDHVEKLLLTFDLFEGQLGMAHPLTGQVWQECLNQLTPAFLEKLAEKHLIPCKASTKKKFFAGSGDFSGFFPGKCWTEAPTAYNVSSFFKHLEDGFTDMQGEGAQLSTQILAWKGYALRAVEKRIPAFAQSKMTQLVQGKNSFRLNPFERLCLAASAVKSGDFLAWLDPSSLERRASEVLQDSEWLASVDTILEKHQTPEERLFQTFNSFLHEMLCRQIQLCVNSLENPAKLDRCIHQLLRLTNRFLPLALLATSSQPNRAALQKMVTQLDAPLPDALKNKKRVWFTDTLDDINGVARTIQSMTQHAKEAGENLTLAICSSKKTSLDLKIKSFSPLASWPLPEYELLTISVPNLLEVLEWVEREAFTECIISTPGPMGITGLLAAKILGLPVTMIDHTDFPHYTRILSRDPLIENLTWRGMDAFYFQADTLFVNSQAYKTRWLERGFPSNKIRILPRGVDTELFNPNQRDPHFWEKYGRKNSDAPVILYVGRISKEKELFFLAEVFQNLHQAGCKSTFAFVGEGPFQKELANLLPGTIFTGVLSGKPLATAYASADLFVFPSTTDTFGNAVLEAIFCGLPAFVSNIGGPQELVANTGMGQVLPARDLAAWSNALKDYLQHPTAYEQRLEKSQNMRAQRSWAKAFQAFWNHAGS